MPEPAAYPDADALEDALLVVTRTLVVALGLPPDEPDGPRVPAAGVEPTVHPDRVPNGPYRLACNILEATGIALVALEDQVAGHPTDGIAAAACVLARVPQRGDYPTDAAHDAALGEWRREMASVGGPTPC